MKRMIIFGLFVGIFYTTYDANALILFQKTWQTTQQGSSNPVIWLNDYVVAEPTESGWKLTCSNPGDKVCDWNTGCPPGPGIFYSEYDKYGVITLENYANTQINNNVLSGYQTFNVYNGDGSIYYRSVTWSVNSNMFKTIDVSITEVQ